MIIAIIDTNSHYYSSRLPSPTSPRTRSPWPPPHDGGRPTLQSRAEAEGAEELQKQAWGRGRPAARSLTILFDLLTYLGVQEADSK